MAGDSWRPGECGLEGFLPKQRVLELPLQAPTLWHQDKQIPSPGAAATCMPQAQGWYPGAPETQSKAAGFVLGHPTDTPLWTRYQGSRSQSSDLPSQSPAGPRSGLEATAWSRVGKSGSARAHRAGTHPGLHRIETGGQSGCSAAAPGWDGGQPCGGGSAYRCSGTGVTGAGGQEARRRRKWGPRRLGWRRGISEGMGMAEPEELRGAGVLPALFHTGWDRTVLRWRPGHRGNPRLQPHSCRKPLLPGPVSPLIKGAAQPSPSRVRPPRLELGAGAQGSPHPQQLQGQDTVGASVRAEGFETAQARVSGLAPGPGQGPGFQALGHRPVSLTMSGIPGP